MPSADEAEEAPDDTVVTAVPEGEAMPNECVFCVNAPKVAALIPCGHTCLCEACARRSKSAAVLPTVLYPLRLMPQCCGASHWSKNSGCLAGTRPPEIKSSRGSFRIWMGQRQAVSTAIQSICWPVSAKYQIFD